MHRARMRLLGSLPKQAVGAEIGVHLGEFSSEILRVAEPHQLLLIDPWKYERGEEYNEAWYGGKPATEREMEKRYRSVQTRFAAEIESGRVVLIRKDSQTVLSQLDDGSLDFVYIDGNHLYEFAKKDLELSLRKVRSGGTISGDDYAPDGWWNGGVKKAVDEFASNRDVSLAWINARQFVFRRK